MDDGLIVLNDQGGSVMNVSDKANTLRAQDHGHPPVVCFEPGIMSRDCSAGNRAYVDICSTLRAQMGDNQPAVCYAIDQQGGKSNCGYAEDVMMTLCSDSHGTPHAVCYEQVQIAHMDVCAISKQLNTAHDTSATLEATDYKEPMVVCYGICSFESNSMLSDNPYSGFYEAKTTRTLDLNCCNPACNQGGVLVVERRHEGICDREPSE